MGASSKRRTSDQIKSLSLSQLMQGVKTVLLIQDNVDQNLLLSLHLRNSDYEVISIFDAEMGLEKAMSEEAHLILVDLDLPGVEGFRVLHKLKMNSKTYSTPTIGFVGDTSPKLIEQAKTWGVKTFLWKPLCPQDVVDAVDQALKGEQSS